ncbi:TRAP transporter substrate-binding protein [Chloroflexota bacterium]
MKKLFIILAIILVMGALLLGGCTTSTPAPAPALTPAPAPAPAPEPEFVIHNASGQPPKGVQSAAIIFWGELLEARSNGRIKVEHHWSGALGPTKAVLDMIQANTMDGLTHGPPGVYISHMVPWLDLTSLPFTFSSWEEEWVAYDTWLGPLLTEDLEKNGYKVIAVREGGFRQFMSNKRPIHTPDDLKGLKYRVQPGEIETRVAEAWGVIPAVMGFGEVYSALEAGVVDAIDFPIFSSIPLKFFEVTEYTSVAHVKHSSMCQLMNKEYFDSLPADVQEIIMGASKDAFNLERIQILNEEQVATKKLEGMGQKFVYVTPENRAKFRELVKPVYAWAAENYDKAMVERLTGMKF